MALNTEGGLITNPYAIGNIPDVYFKYDMDKLGKIIVLTRGTTRFLQYLQHKIGLKSKRVETFAPRIQDIQELYHFIVPYEASDTTLAGNRKIKVDNKYGKATVKQNDLLVVSDVYFEPLNTTEYSTAAGKVGAEYYLKNEVVFVTGVDENDAAGSGYTYIYLHRGWSSEYAYPSYSNTTAALNASATAPPALTTSMKLFKMGNAFAHGTGFPAGEFAQPYVDGNYLQEMKWAIEVVTEQELERTWLNDSGYTPVSLQTMLKSKQMMHDYEKWLLFSHKTVSFDSRGNPLYTSMGMVPYLANDGDHIIDYSNGGAVQTINYMDINSMGDSIFALGGGTTKTGIFGSTLLTRFQNSFFNKFLFTSEDMSKDFNIPVFKLQTAAGELELVSTYGMNELGWTDKMLVWDFSVPSIEKTVFSGKTVISGGKTVQGDFDLYVMDNIQLPGEMIHKKGFLTIGGFQMRAQPYHGVVTNFPTAVAKYTTETAL